VGPTKISSWMLLVIISFIIVAALKEIFPKKQEVFSADEASAADSVERNLIQACPKAANERASGKDPSHSC